MSEVVPVDVSVDIPAVTITGTRDRPDSAESSTFGSAGPINIFDHRHPGAAGLWQLTELPSSGFFQHRRRWRSASPNSRAGGVRLLEPGLSPMGGRSPAWQCRCLAPCVLEPGVDISAPSTIPAPAVISGFRQPGHHVGCHRWPAGDAGLVRGSVASGSSRASSTRRSPSCGTWNPPEHRVATWGNAGSWATRLRQRRRRQPGRGNPVTRPGGGNLAGRTWLGKPGRQRRVRRPATARRLAASLPGRCWDRAQHRPGATPAAQCRLGTAGLGVVVQWHQQPGSG